MSYCFASPNKLHVEYKYFTFSDYLFKLLLIGDSGVGKSCLLLRFAVSNTLNMNFDFCITCQKKLYLGGKSIVTADRLPITFLVFRPCSR